MLYCPVYNVHLCRRKKDTCQKNNVAMLLTLFLSLTAVCPMFKWFTLHVLHSKKSHLLHDYYWSMVFTKSHLLHDYCWSMVFTILCITKQIGMRPIFHFFFSFSKCKDKISCFVFLKILMVHLYFPSNWNIWSVWTSLLEKKQHIWKLKIYFSE